MGANASLRGTTGQILGSCSSVSKQTGDISSPKSPSTWTSEQTEHLLVFGNQMFILCQDYLILIGLHVRTFLNWPISFQLFFFSFKKKEVECPLTLGKGSHTRILLKSFQNPWLFILIWFIILNHCPNCPEAVVCYN